MGSYGVIRDYIPSKCQILGYGKMPFNELIYIGTSVTGIKTYIKVTDAYHQNVDTKSYTHILYHLTQYYPNGDIKYDGDTSSLIYHHVGRTAISEDSRIAVTFPLVGNTYSNVLTPAKRTDAGGVHYNTVVITAFEEIDPDFFDEASLKTQAELLYSIRREIINKSHHYVLNHFDCSQFVGRSKETNELMFGNAIIYTPKLKIVQGGKHNYGYCYHADIGYFYEDWCGVVDPDDNSQYDNGTYTNECEDLHDSWYIPKYRGW